MFRIIARINDPPSVDKLLSIPQSDFNLEEVHRVAVACEVAKNYSGLNDKPQNASYKVLGKKPLQKHQATNPGKSSSDHKKDPELSHEDIHQDHRSLSGAAKIEFLPKN